MLLTVTFDPERDTPEVLATYAARFNADPKMWRFLTGKVADVRRVCALFGVESYLDEGLDEPLAPHRRRSIAAAGSWPTSKAISTPRNSWAISSLRR